MNEFVTMADGTIIKDAYIVGLDDGIIAVYVRGEQTFSKMIKLFNNKNKTRSLKDARYGDDRVWEGYTEIIALEIREDNNSYVVLQQENG